MISSISGALEMGAGQKSYRRVSLSSHKQCSTSTFEVLDIMASVAMQVSLRSTKQIYALKIIDKHLILRNKHVSLSCRLLPLKMILSSQIAFMLQPRVVMRGPTDRGQEVSVCIPREM